MLRFEVCLFVCPGEGTESWLESCRAIDAYARAARACGLTDEELQRDILDFWPEPGRSVEVVTGADATICIYLVAQPPPPIARL